MIPAPFEYEVAESAEHAIELLGRRRTRSSSRPQPAAAADEVPLARPATLVDIGRLSDLAGVRDGDHLAIGALTRHHDLEHDALVQEQCPILAYAGVGRRPAGATPGHDRRLAGPLRSGRRLADGRADAGRGDRAAWARRRARDAGRGVLPRLLRDDVRAGRAGRRGARAENRRSGLVVCQVPPPCTRLGDRGRRAVVEGNGSIERARIGLTNMGQTPVRAKRPSRRSPAPRRTASPPPRRKPTRGRTRPATRGRAPISAATSPASSLPGRSRKR